MKSLGKGYTACKWHCQDLDPDSLVPEPVLSATPFKLPTKFLSIWYTNDLCERKKTWLCLMGSVTKALTLYTGGAQVTDS